MVASTVEMATTVYEREIVGTVPEDLLLTVLLHQTMKTASERAF